LKYRYFLIVDYHGTALSNIDVVDPWGAGKGNEICTSASSDVSAADSPPAFSASSDSSGLSLF
jgi:hypothetical protein